MTTTSSSGNMDTKGSTTTDDSTLAAVVENGATPATATPVATTSRASKKPKIIIDETVKIPSMVEPADAPIRISKKIIHSIDSQTLGQQQQQPTKDKTDEGKAALPPPPAAVVEELKKEQEEERQRLENKEKRQQQMKQMKQQHQQINEQLTKTEKDLADTDILSHLADDVELYQKRVQQKRQIEVDLENISTVSDGNEGNGNAVTDDAKSSGFGLGDDTRLTIGELGTKKGTKKHNKRKLEDGEQQEGSISGNKSARQTSVWTKAEDDAIVYYKEELKYPWKSIEEVLKGRHSWQAIQMRYLRNYKSRKDKWSRYMEVKLINAIRKDWEGRWKRISSELTGESMTVERCVLKNVDLCKKIDDAEILSIFENKEITSGYSNSGADIKDAESHKKLMLVYMGLDSISYESDDETGSAAATTSVAGSKASKDDGESAEVAITDES